LFKISAEKHVSKLLQSVLVSADDSPLLPLCRGQSAKFVITLLSGFYH